MKIAITGAEGQLGAAFCAFFRKQNIPYSGFTKEEWNICSIESGRKRFAQTPFNLVVNCAAFTDVERAEDESDRCMEVNGHGPETLAHVCLEHRAKLVHFSTDYVFDGKKDRPYKESDATYPINVYGKSKLLGEEKVRHSGCPFLLFRISWLFGGKRAGFLDKVEQRAQHQATLRITTDEISGPTYCEHVPVWVWTCLVEGLTHKTIHLCNQGSCSRYEWVRFYAKHCLNEGVRVEPASSIDFKTKAERPKRSVLDNAYLGSILSTTIPSWQEATLAYHARRYE